jgi:hypothetical protein
VSSAPTDVLVDVNGYFPDLSAFVSLEAPARVLDSRNPGGHTIDGQTQALGRVAAGKTFELPIAGRAGVPTGAASVAINVTVVAAGGDGFLTVFPCGQPVPDASNLNFTSGQTIPNEVIAKIGTGGKLCLYSSATTDILVDVAGYFPDALGFVPLVAPTRLLDTRKPGGRTADGQYQAGGRVAGGVTFELPVSGRTGVPAAAASVALNVTVVGASDPGYLTVFPCGQPVPEASNLNFVRGLTVPNAVLSEAGNGGKVCLYSSAPTDVLVDVTGYFM